MKSIHIQPLPISKQCADMMRSLLLTFLLIGLSAVCLPAKEKPTSLLTGGVTGTYVTFGNNIAEVANKKPYNHKVDVLPSHGSIDNIKRITSSNGAIPLGIVQSDILGFLSRSTNDNTRAIASRLSLIFPFYEEEVHILARKPIKGLSGLTGMRVVVGLEGSGNMLTAMNIMALSGVQPSEIIHAAPAEGVVSVLSDEADALIFVGGKPVTLFTNLADLKTAHKGKNAHLLDAIHFVPVDDQRVFSEYSPTRINAGDYPFVDNAVLTAKVNAVLVSYEPPELKGAAREAYCKPLQQISRAIVHHMEYLRDSAHPKWKEVNLYADLNIWPRNSCVWEGKRFIGAPEATAAVPVKVAPKVRDALSKDLLDVVKFGTKDNAEQ